MKTSHKTKEQKYNNDRLTTETKVALDISGISLGGGESPVRFKFGLKEYEVRYNY
jgi:hypothetical protein